MLRDEAHAFLQAGAAIESGRHGAADAARRAARRRPTPTTTRATARRWRCCRRSAASRPTGARCPRRRTPRPVARFLLYERDYPDSVAVLGRGAARGADRRRRELPQLAGRCCALGRLMADLDFRARAAEGDGAAGRDARRRPARARAGRCRHRRALLRRRGAAGRAASRRLHELRHPLPDRVPLRRRRSPTTSTRCACKPATTPTQRVRRLRACASTPRRGCTSTSTTSAPTVIEFGDLAAARAPVDRRPRARDARARPTARRRRPGRRSRTRLPRGRRASSCCPSATEPDDVRARRAASASRAPTRRWPRCAARAS